ncbi:MAG TPA: ABC transporter substrate-binding protein [Stellaceae bacterium]|nr:ABC transporter substrate-binding protein [Stellaceae bacterium]
MLTGLSESDPTIQPGIEEFRQALRAKGWREGDNLQVVQRFAAGDPERVRGFVAELISQHPDAIVAHTALVVAALHQATRALPIVFVSIPDPVTDGFVANLARPGGNMTGFTNYDFAIGSKWLEVLTEITPATRRVGVLLNPDAKSSYASYAGYWRSVEAAAGAMPVAARLSPVRNSDEIEGAIAALAAEPGGGLIVPPSAPVTAHIGRIIELTARHRVPAIYGFASHARQGGLVSYGTSLTDLFRRAADYVDRILKGAKPADLPVQGPTKFELVINLKTAKALGLAVPQSLLARADEVIE